QLPAQPNRQRHRVGRAAPLQPLQEPQPPLRKRQRHLRRTLDRTQRCPTHPRVPQTLHKPTNRPRPKHAADRYLNIKARTEPADQTPRKQRVTPKRKEPVVNPNPIDPENPRKQGTQTLPMPPARHTTTPRPKP